MATLAEIRKKYPEYDAMPDKELADKMHAKFYADMPIAEFYGKVGYTGEKPESLGAQLTHGPKNIAAGLGKFGHKLINIPSMLAGALGDEESKKLLSWRPNYDYSKAVGLPSQLGLSDRLLQASPEILGSLAVPGANLGKAGQLISKIPAAGKYLNAAASEAIPQALYAGALGEEGHRGEAAATAGATTAPFAAASQFAKSPLPAKQKLLANILGGAGGVGAYYGANYLGAPEWASATAGALAGLIGNKAAGTKGMMMQELAGGKNAKLAQDRLAASQRIGLDFITPEEAFNSPFLARKQGQLGRTEEGSELLYDKFHQRNVSEQNAIDKVLNDIHDPDIMGPQAEALYKKSYESNLPPELIANLSQNEVVKHAINDVLKRPAYREKLKDVPVESFAFWDHVKRALGDMAEDAPRSEAKIINDARKSLVGEMDAISPDYKQARALEERKFAREGLEKVFDKTNIHSGHAFFKALNSKEDFEKLMHNLRDIPEIGQDMGMVRQSLKDMRELFKDFRAESKTNKVRGLEQTGMKQDRNAVNKAISMFENMFSGGKFDKEAIEFITSPNWAEQLKEINKITDKQKKMAKTIEVFGKIAAQGAAKQAPFMVTASGKEIYDQ